MKDPFCIPENLICTKAGSAETARLIRTGMHANSIRARGGRQRHLNTMPDIWPQLLFLPNIRFLLHRGADHICTKTPLKRSQTPGRLALGVIIAVVGMTASGPLLWLAQRDIPIGTAYAVWTGIGAVGTALLGIVLFGESASPARLLCIGLILAGIAGLKLLSDA